MIPAEIDIELLSGEKGCVIPFWSDGSWSLHELLEKLLSLAGPSDIMISSYSISENSIRSIFNICEAGLIRKIRCLFDYRVRKDKIGILLFASNVISEIYLAQCHAKIILIKNDLFTITVITSANLTVNVRYECGAVFNDKYIYEYYRSQLQYAIKNAALLNFNE
jgi:hypothetical protein